MKLERWALLAEVLSGIAVVVTLVFLVIGLEKNTKVTQAAAYQDLLDGLNQFNIVLMSDGDLAMLWLGRVDRSLADMEPRDASRLIFMNRTVYRIFDSAYFAFRNGSLGPAQWARFEKSICNVHRTESPNYRDLWSETEGLVSAEFISYLDGSCSD